MKDDIKEILFNAEEIDAKVTEIANKLNDCYKGQEVVMVGVLKGCLPFYIDLARKVNFPVRFDFICASSYGSGTESSGNLKISKDLSAPIENKNVLIIEDILDSGNTLSKLYDNFSKRNPKSLRMCCFLDKPSRRVSEINVDFIGFSIPDEFVVGYGLDYAERFRELPYIGILKPEIYQNN